MRGMMGTQEIRVGTRGNQGGNTENGSGNVGITGNVRIKVEIRGMGMGMQGIMVGMLGIRVGMQGTRVGMWGIRVGMRGIGVGMLGIRVGMRGIEWNRYRKKGKKVYKI